MGYSKHRLKEVVALQQAVLRRIEADLGEFGPLPSRKYIEEFHQEFQTFDAACPLAEVVNAASSAPLVWIGDYHALGRSRVFAAELLREVAERKPCGIALGVEVVFARHQKSLEKWLRGDISEKEFLETVRYLQEWGCDWNTYKILFETARDLEIPVYGLDSKPRNDMRRIGSRDQAVARRVAQILEDDPSRSLFVVFGESHLASSHLPRRVPCPDQLLILQNQDSIYWGLQRQGQEDVRSVRLSSRKYCVLNATPLEKYESFRQYLMRCVDDDESTTDWTCLVHTVIDAIFDFMDMDRSPDLVDWLPPVYSEVSAAGLQKLLTRFEVPPSQVKRARRSMLEHGASYIPTLNAMFIDDFRLDYTTEEAARFIHQICRGELQCTAERAVADVFFLGIIEHALAYFFSKLFDPSREDVEQLGSRVLQYIGYNGELTRTVTRLLDMEKRPSSQLFQRLRSTVEQESGRPRMLQLLAQVLGYGLGRKLHKAYMESRISRKEIQSLLQDPLAAPDQPLECYAELSARLC